MGTNTIKDRRGSGERFYSRRIVLFAAAVAAVVAAVCCAIVLLAVTSVTRHEACIRQNAIRTESNRRAPLHAQDADNLRRLARGLGKHRQIEADTFAAIGRAFHIQRQVAPLVAVDRRGSRLDLHIAAQEARVSFKRLPVPGC